MKFPTQQYKAIVREKAADRATPVALLSSRIKELAQKERLLNDTYWSLFHRGTCTDEPFADHLMHERNALRVRIMRLQKRQFVS